MPDASVDPTAVTVAFVAGAALLAGWVDAVVGGGGLIQLPALLLGFPTASPAQILATNKFSSIFGTTTSAVTYYRRVHPDLRTALPMAAVAFVGSILGALIGLHIPKAAFNPIVLVCLVVVGAYTLLKPELGRETALRWSGHRHRIANRLQPAGHGAGARELLPRPAACEVRVADVAVAVAIEDVW